MFNKNFVEMKKLSTTFYGSESEVERGGELFMKLQYVHKF